MLSRLVSKYSWEQYDNKTCARDYQHKYLQPKSLQGGEMEFFSKDSQLWSYNSQQLLVKSSS